MTRIPVYLFADLDDSLIQTEVKCPPGPRMTAAHDRDGQPLSYHSPQQLALLALLGDTPLIPVTGRSLEALRRVVSPRFSSFRIVSHGALVLDPDDNLLPSWEGPLRAAAVRWRWRLEEALAWILERIATRGLPLRAKLIEDQGVPVYVSIKGPEERLAELAPEIEPFWSEGLLHHNGHNLALLPPYADKGAAVAHLMEELGAGQDPSPLFIGLGDSLTDLPFLKRCHFALVPQGSQIQRARWS